LESVGQFVIRIQGTAAYQTTGSRFTKRETSRGTIQSWSWMFGSTRTFSTTNQPSVRSISRLSFPISIGPRLRLVCGKFPAFAPPARKRTKDVGCSISGVKKRAGQVRLPNHELIKSCSCVRAENHSTQEQSSKCRSLRVGKAGLPPLFRYWLTESTRVHLLKII